MHFGQLVKTPDPATIYSQLGYGSGAMGDTHEFALSRWVIVQHDLMEANMPFLQQVFGLYADRAPAGTVNGDSVHHACESSISLVKV